MHFVIMLFQSCMIFLLQRNMKGDILKNIRVQTTLDPADFHCKDKKEK